MKITLESTTTLVDVQGVPARVWEGQTESGIPVTCLVTRIATPDVPGAPLEQFKRELQECRPPVLVDVWPARLIL